MKKVFILLMIVMGASACSQSNPNDIVAEGEAPVRVSDSFSFTEGPAVDAEGNVYFTDQPNNRIYRWDCETGQITLFTDQSGRSNGMYFDEQGKLIACADMDNQLWSFDMKGHSQILVTDFGGKLLNGPNDVWISKNGGYYLTDPYFKRDYWTRDTVRQQPVEGLYYLAPGAKQLTMLDSTLNQPNGIVGTPDGKHLYVAEAKANRILRYDIQPDGLLTDRQVFADMGSDGMTIDDRGNIYLTGNGVTVYDKSGQKIAHFPIPEDWTANVCFGGKERNVLFITASKSVYTMKMLVHGVDSQRIESTKTDKNMTNEQLREKMALALEDMKAKALEMGIEGVAAASVLNSGDTVNWIGEMKVVGKYLDHDGGFNLVAVAWSKCAEVMATLADSGNPNHKAMTGELNYTGGAYDEYEGIKMAFAFSGATSEEDYVVAKHGIAKLKDYISEGK